MMWNSCCCKPSCPPRQALYFIVADSCDPTHVGRPCHWHDPADYYGLPVVLTFEISLRFEDFDRVDANEDGIDDTWTPLSLGPYLLRWESGRTWKRYSALTGEDRDGVDVEINLSEPTSLGDFYPGVPGPWPTIILVDEIRVRGVTLAPTTEGTITITRSGFQAQLVTGGNLPPIWHEVLNPALPPPALVSTCHDYSVLMHYCTRIYSLDDAADAKFEAEVSGIVGEPIAGDDLRSCCDFANDTYTMSFASSQLTVDGWVLAGSWRQLPIVSTESCGDCEGSPLNVTVSKSAVMQLVPLLISGSEAGVGFDGVRAATNGLIECEEPQTPGCAPLSFRPYAYTVTAGAGIAPVLCAGRILSGVGSCGAEKWTTINKFHDPWSVPLSGLDKSTCGCGTASGAITFTEL